MTYNQYHIRQSIKERCADCCPNETCKDVSCKLYRIRESETIAQVEKRIEKYCRWCMHGNKIQLCRTKNCSLNKHIQPEEEQYLFELEGEK